MPGSNAVRNSGFGRLARAGLSDMNDPHLTAAISPAMLICGPHRLPLDRPLVMGVLNVTPDSFSDGGRFLDPSTALDHARKMIDDGADIIDIGGESTRPGTAPTPDREELRRVVPLIEKIAALGVSVSAD